MKKLLFAAFVALLALASCGEREYLSYKGLSMGMSAKAFADSVAARGFIVDTALSTFGKGASRIEMRSPDDEEFRLSIVSKNDTLLTVEEVYTRDKINDTRAMWKRLREDYVKELGTCAAPTLNDDHKVAIFKSKKGTMTLILQNNPGEDYAGKPTVRVRFETKI